mgnify:CR=1 FL=1
MSRVIVVGSINQDVSVTVDRFPSPGKHSRAPLSPTASAERARTRLLRPHTRGFPSFSWARSARIPRASYCELH